MSLPERVVELLEKVVTMSTKYEALEKSFERLIDRHEKFTERMSENYRDLDRRITTIEGTLASTFQTSLKEALTQLGREYLKEHGSLEGFSPNLLGDRKEE